MAPGQALNEELYTHNKRVYFIKLSHVYKLLLLLSSLFTHYLPNEI